ncbi:NB-ARC domain-containing protein, partial [Streptomyces boncukensis]|uniref:NB-ARC domain-containing protein n=1 Tax=Streptomyces boncukensis TaxID=2711219 RepID=UPI001F49E58D
RTLLDALGVSPRDIPAPLDARAALYRSLLAGRRMLVLLDDARDSAQVRPLLPGSAHCRVIVTGRSRLTGLIAGGGARPLTLGPLAPAEAHDFLARRLGAARVAAEPWPAHEIAERCGRLPLALAVVAARVATHPGFSLGTVAGELREARGGLDAFTGGEPSTDVRTAFSWSYQALSAPAARLFRLLGLHGGPDISADAAAALAGLPLGEARGLLAEAARGHLLTEHAPGRYTPHDLLRVYAAERVAAQEPPPERERAVQRLLSWYLHAVDVGCARLAPLRRPGCDGAEFTSRDQALRWFEDERPNIVAAAHQAAASRRPDLAWRLTTALWWLSCLRGHPHHWLSAARTALLGAHEALEASRGGRTPDGSLGAAVRPSVPVPVPVRGRPAPAPRWAWGRPWRDGAHESRGAPAT